MKSPWFLVLAVLLCATPVLAAEPTTEEEKTIYAIGLRNASEGNSRGFNEAEFVLRQLSQETGGRAFFPNHINALASVYTLIANELSSQYTLGYTPRNARNDGTFRRIQVRVQRPGLTARTKQGYFAPTAR